ncbi:CBO0543 family protein [Rossellomorea aquimaris]|uniref:CBO0543 family protein n=1 Tax=Rossellomorea aquimaris TaxID=189382 RepID=UPI0007D08761|nr:CBO0543 family protein [Rossellomorea aquimaris]
MILTLLFIYIFIGWKFGNWKEFHSYYSTILFFIIGDLLSQFLLYDYSMWKFQAISELDQSLKLNHTLISLLKMIVQYTVTVAIFIGRLPSSLLKKVIWVGIWTGIFAITEGFTHFIGIMTYHHGWHFGWDLIFNVMMLSVLIIHHKRPIVAWIISFPIVLFLWFYFDVPYSVMK